MNCTKDLGMFCYEFLAVSEGYLDANWISNVTDNKSTKGLSPKKKKKIHIRLDIHSWWDAVTWASQK